MATCVVDNKILVVQQLSELFGSTVDTDIIESVAINFHYDINASLNHLIEISTSEAMEKNSSEYSAGFQNNYGIPSAPSSPSKSKKDTEIEKAIGHINADYKVLVLLRGMPGSGKSTLAKRILQETVGCDEVSVGMHILSSDDFFMRNGKYDYNPTLIPDAHGWNQNRAFKNMRNGVSPIIIDNTNSQLWEMKPYAVMATDYGYIIDILEPATHWCFNEKELYKRNRHGVPKDRIKTMLQRYEKNITTPKLLTAYKLYYKQIKPPDIRLYPPPNNRCQQNRIATSTVTSKDVVESNTFSIGQPRDTNNMNNINLYSCRENQKVTAEKDLMDFTDVLKPSSSSSNTENIAKSWSTLDLLMGQNTNNANSFVLLPEKQKSLENKSKSAYPDLTAWGVDEAAIRSWDIVTPIEDTNTDIMDLTIEDDDDEIQKTDSSVNTDDRIFSLMRTPQFQIEGLNIIQTYNRDINRNAPILPRKIQKTLMLEKSCLTDDIYEDREIHIEQLTSLFPHIPLGHLNYWYDKCKGDMDWTIELILASKDEILEVPIESEAINNTEIDDNSPVVVDSDSGNSSKSETVRITKSKRKSYNWSSSESQELKKAIESKVNIGDDWYSKHILKIKQIRFGSNDKSQPSTSKMDQDEGFEVSPTSTGSSNSKIDHFHTAAGDVMAIDSDVEFDDLDLENSDTDVKERELNCTGHVETMELNLGQFFVQQLESNFGDASLKYPKGFQPVVQVPVNLAKQLYTFYVESVFQQLEAQNAIMESLVKEDEEFARKLQAEENSSVCKETNDTPNLQNIMEEQAQLRRQQKEVDKWKDLTPDNLAAKLTRDKLFKVFPKINQDVLVEILHAHDNKYADTVETLLASTTPSDVIGSPESVRKLPIEEEVIEELRDAQNQYGLNMDDEPASSTSHTAQYYREVANKYLKKRKEIYEKANRYHSKGMTAVAQYYSGLAAKQTDYYDHANQLAATTFLDEHAERLKDFNTLDLHYLYVKEAMPALDLFLDRNINLLRLSTSKQAEYLQIITGRGNRSENGRSKLKPAVSSRLNARNIKFQNLNPGMMKIKISKNTLLTSEL